MDVFKIYEFFAHLFRRRRMKSFMATFNVGSDTRILDVGGSTYNWQLYECTSRITILNLEVPTDVTA